MTSQYGEQKALAVFRWTSYGKPYEYVYGVQSGVFQKLINVSNNPVIAADAPPNDLLMSRRTTRRFSLL